MKVAAFSLFLVFIVQITANQNQCWYSGCAVYNGGGRCGAGNVELEKTECCGDWDTNVLGKRCGYCCITAADCKMSDLCVPNGCEDCSVCPEGQSEPPAKHSKYNPIPCETEVGGKKWKGSRYFCCKTLS